MLRVGLTGGLASGKTFAGSVLAELGCHVLQADKLGHAVLDGPARNAVLEAFGPGVADPATGRVDRKKLGAIVFNNPAQLEQLNKIVHPLVFEQQEQWFADVAERDPRGIAVVEAAIMIETGSHQRYQKLILAFCSEPEQIRRAMAREGWTEAEVRARLARQMPLKDKIPYADYLLDTSGSPEQTRRRIQAIFENLKTDALQKERK